jgi:hypothetical protein
MAGREVRAELDDDVAAGGKGEVKAVGVGHWSRLHLKACVRRRFRDAPVVAPER